MIANNKLFLDTCGWLALLNSADALHENARQIWALHAKMSFEIYLTDWIIAETGNGLARSKCKPQFVQAIQKATSSQWTTIVQVDNNLLSQGLELYENRADNNWGLVDCVSFCVMSNENIFDAFTNDHHFTQAGFHGLLSST